MQSFSRQRGNTVLGFILGLVVGLTVALVVAIYVTKVPIPFLDKGLSRNAEQDAAEQKKNKDWDPNAPLYGKSPAANAPALRTSQCPIRRQFPRLLHLQSPVLRTPWAIWRLAKPKVPMLFIILCRLAPLTAAKKRKPSKPSWLWVVLTPKSLSVNKTAKSSTECV
jgi:hypothetical protein